MVLVVLFFIRRREIMRGGGVRQSRNSSFGFVQRQARRAVLRYQCQSALIQRVNSLRFLAFSCAKRIWSPAFTRPAFASLRRGKPGPAEAGTPNESVSIGVHPWLKFFASRHLCVEKNQRSSASISGLTLCVLCVLLRPNKSVSIGVHPPYSHPSRQVSVSQQLTLCVLSVSALKR